jgi:hypothetical protein
LFFYWYLSCYVFYSAMIWKLLCFPNEYDNSYLKSKSNTFKIKQYNTLLELHVWVHKLLTVLSCDTCFDSRSTTWALTLFYSVLLAWNANCPFPFYGPHTLMFGMTKTIEGEQKVSMNKQKLLVFQLYYSMPAIVLIFRW